MFNASELQSFAKSLGIPIRAPNPYYLLPRAEMDKMPESYEGLMITNYQFSYNSGCIELIGSRDDRRSQDIHYFSPGIVVLCCNAIRKYFIFGSFQGLFG